MQLGPPEPIGRCPGCANLFKVQRRYKIYRSDSWRVRSQKRKDKEGNKCDIS